MFIVQVGTDIEDLNLECNVTVSRRNASAKFGSRFVRKSLPWNRDRTYTIPGRVDRQSFCGSTVEVICGEESILDVVTAPEVLWNKVYPWIDCASSESFVVKIKNDDVPSGAAGLTIIDVLWNLDADDFRVTRILCCYAKGEIGDIDECVGKIASHESEWFGKTLFIDRRPVIKSTLAVIYSNGCLKQGEDRKRLRDRGYKSHTSILDGSFIETYVKYFTLTFNARSTFSLDPNIVTVDKYNQTKRKTIRFCRLEFLSGAVKSRSYLIRALYNNYDFDLDDKHLVISPSPRAMFVRTPREISTESVSKYYTDTFKRAVNDGEALKSKADIVNISPTIQYYKTAHCAGAAECVEMINSTSATLYTLSSLSLGEAMAVVHYG